MAPRNPLGMVSDAAVGVIASGVRAAASLINSAAGAAKGLVGKSDEAAPKDLDKS
jgi:hypothetical protein